MGTSEVLPSAIGSGGAVTSWLCLYSENGCEESVLTVFKSQLVAVSNPSEEVEYGSESKKGTKVPCIDQLTAGLPRFALGTVSYTPGSAYIPWIISPIPTLGSSEAFINSLLTSSITTSWPVVGSVTVFRVPD